MDKIIGFIGSGNMGSAMITGIINANIVSANNIVISDVHEDRLQKFKSDYNVNVTTNNCEVAKQADILILSVKPNIYSSVINEIKGCIKDDAIIVSIAAGKTIENVKNLFGKEIKIVRAMPNTPALVGVGMTAIAPNPMALPNDIDDIMNIFKSIGKCEIVPEYLMEAVTAVSGSAPAYIYMIIEAMADAAVLEGLPRDKAYIFASQTVLGSAKMVLETGKHPAELKDMVCSPGGTTIEAVSVLEKTGLRSSIMSAMKACADKSRQMSK